MTVNQMIYNERRPGGGKPVFSEPHVSVAGDKAWGLIGSPIKNLQMTKTLKRDPFSGRP